MNTDRSRLLRARIRNHERLIGGWLQLGSASVASLIATGMDWTAIDLEHGDFDRASLPLVVRAIENSGSVPLARIAKMDMTLGSQALDSGCAGLIVPQVRTATSLQDFMSAVSLPPAGTRGVGFFAGNNYGQDFYSYLRNEQRPLVIPMIENREALQNLPKILKLEEIDAVLIGPYDLSASLGRPGDFAATDFVEALEEVKFQCRKYGVTLGVHEVLPREESIHEKLAEGFRLIGVGTDAIFLREYARTVQQWFSQDSTA